MARPKKYWWSGNYGNELQLTLQQAEQMSHPGDCETDVRIALALPEIRDQVEAWDPEDTRKELSEYGAWDDKELADDEMNKVRMLWIAAGDIADEHGGK